MDASPSAMLRRLTLQQAPIADVVPHAKSLSQSEIVQQLGIGTRDWAALPLAYRQRLLKQILARLTARSMLAAGGDDDEINEALLDAMLRPNADADEDGWSTSTFEILNAPLRLRVFGGIGGGLETGGRVWPAALGLSAYLFNLHRSGGERQILAGCRTVLELGAGPGLPGLLLARLGFGGVERVLLTDYIPKTLENLKRNVAQLEPAEAAKRCEVAALDWHQSAEVTAATLPADGSSNLILAADVVYEPTLAKPLLTTLCALLTNNGGPSNNVALLAAERRGTAWEVFSAQLAECVARGELKVEERSDAIRQALREEGCPFYCAADAAERLVLLALTAGGSQAAAPTTAANGLEPDALSGGVETSVAALSGSSVRLQVKLS